METPKSIKVIISTFLLFSFLSSCINDDIQVDTNPNPETISIDSIGPISIDEIEGGFWRNENHAQGICFTENGIVISNTFQLIKWNFDVNRVVDERRCWNISEGCDNKFHYGDIASGEGDLWVAYHEGEWEENFDCNINRIIRYEDEVISEEYTPIIYNVDYQGHIGAIEVYNGKLYVSGKFIPNDYDGEECFDSLVIYVYDIASLDESATCNMHEPENEIIIDRTGRWGVQALSITDDGFLFIAPYKCPYDTESFVYQTSLTDGLFTTINFTNENWGFGLDNMENGKIFYCEDNRNKEAFYVKQYKR